MNKYLVITIDVEPDCSPTWHYSSPLTFEGVSRGIRDVLQPLFNRYDMAPTYLINNVVLEDGKSCDILSDLPGDYELGTHLHPEFIEPQKSEHDYGGKRGAANCCEYAPDIEYKKLVNITRLFEKRFGYAPKSFRVGRFSAGPNTIDSLAKLGYTVDTSVTPHVRWDGKSRSIAIDYSKTPEQPYMIRPGAFPLPGEKGGIVEIPVSVTTQKTGFLKEAKWSWLGMRRPYRRTRPVWLRPVYSGYEEFLRVTTDHTERYRENDMIVFNMMFHNVEVLPGMSPYTKTQKDCENYLQLLEDYFRYCSRHGIKGITLQRAAELYKQKNKPVPLRLRWLNYLMPALPYVSESVTELALVAAV